jgi:phytoene synthase
MPRRSPDALARREDLAWCAATLRTGSRTFHAASYLLPREVREPAIALYAFCRLADDAVDRPGAGMRALEGVRERLDRVYARRPLDHPSDRAFADVVTRFGIPRAMPDALVEGFAWDLAGRRYATIADLEAYALRVAGAVGAMMAMLMGVRSADAFARACELGMAMQLSNIARDVGEDARHGRLYLPTDWMADAGIDSGRWLARPAHDERLGVVVERVLGHAERLYSRVESGIAALPVSCRPGIRAASRLYREIGLTVRKRGLDAVSSRAVVPATRKVALVLTAIGPGGSHAPAPGAPAPESARPLVAAAVAAAGLRAIPAGAARRAPAPSRISRILDIVERLERHDRARSSA